MTPQSKTGLPIIVFSTSCRAGYLENLDANFSGARQIPPPWPHPKETVGGTGNGERDTRKAPRQRNGMAGGGRLARETTENFIRKDYKYLQQGRAPSQHESIPVNTNIQSVRKRGERNTGVASDAHFPPTIKTRHRNKNAGWSATHRVCNVLGIKQLHDQILMSGRVRREEAGKNAARWTSYQVRHASVATGHPGGDPAQQIQERRTL